MMFDHLVQLAKLYLYKFRIIKFAMVGASGTVLGLSVLYTLAEVASLHYMIAYPMSFVVALTSNYILNCLWTFKQNRGIRGWLKYVVACTPAFAVNMVLMYVLTDISGLWYMLTAVILVLVAFMVNYALSTRFVWARR